MAKAKDGLESVRAESFLRRLVKEILSDTESDFKHYLRNSIERKVLELRNRLPLGLEFDEDDEFYIIRMNKDLADD